MSRSTLLTLAVLVALAGALVGLLLRDDAGGGSSGPATVSRPSLAKASGNASGAKPGPGAKAGGGSRAAGAPGGNAGAPLTGVEEPADDAPRPWPKTAAGFLERIRQISDDHGDSHEEMDEFFKLMEGFYRLLAENPEQRRMALDLFRNEASHRMLEAMAHVLGRIDDDPQLKAAMIQMARSDPSSDRRKEALTVVGYYQTKDSVPVALDILRTDTRTGWQRRALEALPDLPPADLPSGERETVVAELDRMAGSSDAAVREMAYRTLGDWGGADRTGKLIDGLRDTEMTVRAAAAYALALRGETSAEAKEALLRVINDASEDRQVRGVAADALSDWNAKDPDLRAAVASFQAWDRANPEPPFKDPNVEDPTPENAPAESDQG